MVINDIIKRWQERGELQSIKREKYMPYEMSVALDVVTQIGRAMVPGFVIDDLNRWQFEQLIKWVHGDDTMQANDPVTGRRVAGRLGAGLYIAGKTGTGKSLALNIMSLYCDIDNVQVEINGGGRCLRWQNVRVDDICDAYARTGDIAKYKRMPVLCIQDLGAEQAETLYMGTRINVLAQVLEARGDRNDLITLVSSNLPLQPKPGTPNVLEQRYGDRVVSRLREMCNYILMTGNDRRRK